MVFDKNFYIGIDILNNLTQRYQNPAKKLERMARLTRLSLLLCVACMSLTFFFGSGLSRMQFGLLCKDYGSFDRRPNTVYTGCLSNDVTVLTFERFDSSSHVVLSCTSVQLIYIENTELTCSEISTLFTTPRALLVQITDPLSSCVSIDYKSKII